MGDFAPMTCPYCGSGPYSGVTLGDRHDDPRARSRLFDCESFLHFNSDMEWTITERCADKARAEADRRLAERDDVIRGLAGERAEFRELIDVLADELYDILQVTESIRRDVLFRTHDVCERAYAALDRVEIMEEMEEWAP